MLNRFIAFICVLGATLVFPIKPFAQNPPARTWPEPVPNAPPVAAKDKKPAPRHSLVGMWGSRAGNQAKGVQLRPNDGKPENQLPYTPHGLELYKSHKPLEGADAVAPAYNTNPGVRCEPL